MKVAKTKTLIRVFRSFFPIRNMHSTSAKSIFTNESSQTDDSLNHREYLDAVRKFIPKLSSHLHKGQCGRIGVIGGSFEYTGAPYFAAISSLKLGADLVYVFCSRSAGPVIKTYSPELMVYSFLDESDVVARIDTILEKLHVLVIGPGLGRDKDVLKNVAEIITHCKKKMKQPLPLVIDADGLYLITEDPSLIKNYNGPLILTPNANEFNRLSIKLGEKDPLKVAAYFGAVLLQKGSVDVIANGIHNQRLQGEDVQDAIIKCDVPGSNRRCGGQGDLLAGFIATLVAWLQIHLNSSDGFDFFNNVENKGSEWLKNVIRQYSMAVYGSCVITRTCNRLAFELHGRGTTASDMIAFINKSFTLHFGQ